MLVVVALGGNAILQRGQALEASNQRENIRLAAKSIAKIAREHKLIITHGNGPQVGLLALQNEAYRDVKDYPLDVLGAQTQGMIGAIFAQELKNLLPYHTISNLITHTVVDKDDQAFKNPDKFIGPIYPKESLKTLREENTHWSIKTDGDSVRRVVASPIPKDIIEINTIRLLANQNKSITICCGGGGVPVVTCNTHQLKPVEAVVDKDLASSVLAQKLDADALLLLTDVDAVETNFGSADSKKIKTISPFQLADLDFAAGSMKPKIEAVCSFAKRKKGSLAAIGALTRASDILAEKVGTSIKFENEVTYY